MGIGVGIGARTRGSCLDFAARARSNALVINATLRVLGRGTAGLAVILAVGLALGACEAKPRAGSRALELELVRPQNNAGVFLNEPLFFSFSAPVDPASVSHGSVSIHTADGEEARGSLLVEGRTLRFVPAPALRPDLSDGGYRPGSEYKVELAGFPRPDGLRGVHGELFERTWSWSFRCVALSTPRTGLIFDDPTPERIKFLALYPSSGARSDGKYAIGPQESIYLACEKPLDPSSVLSGDFHLSPSHGAQVAVHARLIENASEAKGRARPSDLRTTSSPEAWKSEPRAALIELTPREPLAPGTWNLFYHAEHGRDSFSLRDYSAQPVMPSGDGGNWVRSIVVAAEPGDGPHGRYSEDFLARTLRSPVAVPQVDGTAYWGESGRVEVRYPAAAGSGAGRAVQLEEHEDRRDVQATRLTLAAGRTCKLASTPGLVVLRAQGRMVIEGTLERDGVNGEGITFGPSESLSAWLERARTLERSWTVLIAGGDLVIDGAVRCSTPLLLVAGGVIRISGEVEAGAKGELWRLGDGGGLRLFSECAPAPLILDPPLGQNPLVEPLHLAVLSGPIPQVGGVSRWHPVEVQGSSTPRTASDPAPRRSSWRVRYLPEPEAGGESRFSDAAESPLFFAQPSSLRFLVELVVEPGGSWDPPFVDRVELFWDPATR